jgi:CRISPR system Cascade subunit CasE
MFLSRLLLNPYSRQVQRESVDQYQMHRTVMRAFPEILPEDERVLFRLDASPRQGKLTLLVQSQGAPNWDFLLEQERGTPYLQDDDAVLIKPVNLRLSPRAVLGFRLRANPTVCRDGKRHAIYKEEAQLEWLGRKGTENGFALVSARVASQDDIRGVIHRGTEQSHKLKLGVVQFDGYLRVEDPDKLKAAVRSGIGRGKGLGCGLLSLVAPSRIA